MLFSFCYWSEVCGLRHAVSDPLGGSLNDWPSENDKKKCFLLSSRAKKKKKKKLWRHEMNEGNEYQASGKGWVQVHCVLFLMEQISHKRNF